MSTAELLSDEQTDLQEQRWHDAIVMVDKIMPLWHHHATRLRLTMNRSWCPTAAVDGVNLYWNPEFTSRLNDRELVFLLIHEVFHVAAGHIWRGSRYIKGLEGQELQETLRRLNQAADYAIHQIMVPLARQPKRRNQPDYRKAMKFPTGKNRGLFDKRFRNMSMERIYEFLLSHPDDKANGKIQDFDLHIFRGQGGAPGGAKSDEDGNWVLVTDGQGNPIELPEDESGNGSQDDTPQPQDPNLLRVAIKRDIRSSGYGGTEAGKGKGTIDRTATATPDAVKDDWSILTQFIVMNAAADYSYSRPNRSYLSRGLIVPGLRSSSINIVIVIDTSGSINRSAFDLFASNVELIRKQVGDHNLTLIFCDDEIQGDVAVYGPNDEIDWKVRGCGGTSFRPPFQWVDDNLIDPPSCLVYFTDGCCGGKLPQDAPSYPVLWALWGPQYEQPWGVNLKLSDV